MAIPFLNNINLDDNQLQNAKLHVTSSVPAAEAGQIYYNSTANEARYYNGSAWISLVASTGGTVTSVTSGNANTITIGGTATDPTVAANTAAVANGSANLSTGDQIYDFVIGLGYITGNETITLSGDVTGSGTTAITTTIASSAVESGMLNNNIISGQTALTTGLASTDELLISDAGTIKRMDVSVLQSYMQSNLSFSTNTDTLQTISADTTDADRFITSVANAAGAQQGLSHSTLKYNPSTETLKVTNLIVSGTSTTINTETIALADNIITLNSNATGSPSENSGIEVERGDSTNVILRWNESTDRWEFTNDGSTFYNIPISTEYDNFNFNVEVGGSAQEVSDGGTLTFAQGGGLTVGISGNDTITYSHEDTSSQASVNNSGRTYIQDITLDTYGHITGITSATETVTNTDTNTQLATAAALIDVSAMGSNTTASFTHSLGSKNLIVQLYDVSTGQIVFADIDHTSNNAISVIFSSTPANDVRVVVIDAKDGVTDSTVTYS